MVYFWARSAPPSKFFEMQILIASNYFKKQIALTKKRPTAAAFLELVATGINKEWSLFDNWSRRAFLNTVINKWVTSTTAAKRPPS